MEIIQTQNVIYTVLFTGYFMVMLYAAYMIFIRPLNKLIMLQKKQKKLSRRTPPRL